MPRAVYAAGRESRQSLRAPEPTEPCALSPARIAGAPQTISINFIRRDGFSIQAMHMDHRTALGPYVRVQSAATLRRLLAYLGASPAQMAEFDNTHLRWGQGTVQITLAPGRKNLLRLRRTS